MARLTVKALLITTFALGTQPASAGPEENGARHIQIKALTPAMKPAVGAKVYVLPLRWNMFENEQPIRGSSWILNEGITGEAGDYSFAKPDDPFVVAMLHESGYVECTEEDLPADRLMKLSAWCRIRGHIPTRKDSQNISLNSYFGSDYIGHFYKSQSKDGKFDFARVVPGSAILVTNPDEDATVMGESVAPGIRTTYLLSKTAPGEMRDILLDDAGPEVKFRLDLPSFIVVDTPYSHPSHHMTIRRKWPEAPNGLDDDAAEKWRSEFAKSPKGIEMARHPSNYSLSFEMSNQTKDKVIHIPKICPGEYEMLIMSFEGRGRQGVKATTPLVIRAGSERNSIDIGTIRFEGLVGGTGQVHLTAGQEVPEIEGVTLDGKPFKLSAHKGKYVLLDFWATWCGPCRKEIPNLRRLYQEFANDSRIAIVGVSLDNDDATLRKFVNEKQMAWTHVRIGDWKTSDIPKKYGADGIPLLVLIGPDGKIATGHVQDCAHAKSFLEQALASHDDGG